MPRQAAQTNITVLSPRNASAEATKFVPRQVFQDLPFWDELTPAKQNAVMDNGNQLAAAMITHGTSGLAIGAHLTGIYKSVEHITGAFDKIAKGFRFSKGTAYRYMNKFEACQKDLPETIIRAALARGIDVTHGKYVTAIKRLPPPVSLAKATIDGGIVNEYLDNLEAKRKDIARSAKLRGSKTVDEQAVIHEIKHGPRTLLMQCYRLCKNSMNSVSFNGAKKRQKFLSSLVGMLMTEAGLATAMQFEPEGIPPEFRQGRGRPTLVKNKETPEGEAA